MAIENVDGINAAIDTVVRGANQGISEQQHYDEMRLRVAQFAVGVQEKAHQLMSQLTDLSDALGNTSLVGIYGDQQDPFMAALGELDSGHDRILSAQECFAFGDESSQDAHKAVGDAQDKDSPMGGLFGELERTAAKAKVLAQAAVGEAAVRHSAAAIKGFRDGVDHIETYRREALG